ncbi:cell division cycle-associated protein 4-like [Octodon degus]|uniref:Cell division cycle-associated protein 4-like n=1 Tax=Octodon degus TaxID=10160 RepID=A0A6P3VAV1_OCTDE|nr:cell division cycle-associated protein 4-like [Octodon degus]
MFARGLKRKCVDQEEDEEGTLASFSTIPSYSLQQQLLLDMSLVKLQLCHMLVEPNLCHSVHIANTIWQVQEEMTQDDVGHGAAPQSTGRAPLDCLVSTEILCCIVSGPEAGVPASDLRDGPLPGLPLYFVQRAHSAEEPRSPQSSLSEMDSPQENRGSFHKSLDHIFEALEHKSSSSMEDLFSDTDSSYYDLYTVLTGMITSAKPGLCDELEGFAAPAPPPASSWQV